MDNRKPINKRFKAITLSLFLFLGLGAAENLWAQVAIMPLGDSITYDNNIVDTPQNRPLGLRTAYRQPLWLDLLSAGYDVDFVGGEIAGENAVPPFDPDNEGHPGWNADGPPLPPNENIAFFIYQWLFANPADVILLHIGTNDISGGQPPDGVDGVAADIGTILDEIDRYETNSGNSVWVILAQIIKRAPVGNTFNDETTALNNAIQILADNRIAAGDKIIVVDMENIPGFTYVTDTTDPYDDGDMYDALHPNASGYDKMATAWFGEGLSKILPLADAGLDENVNEGDLVQLDATFSIVPQPQVPNVNFLVVWDQILGPGTPIVNLDNPNSLTPTFTAPQVDVNGADLQFQLTISDADNANISDQATVSVTVNDVPVGVTVTVDDVTGIEGTGLTFTVRLNKNVADAFVVTVSLTDITAAGGAAPLAVPEDYANDAVTLNFNGTAGETQTFTVATLDDTVDEGDETFSVRLAASNAFVADSDTAVGTITDNDNTVVNSVSNGGGGGGGGCFIQTVSGLFN